MVDVPSDWPALVIERHRGSVGLPQPAGTIEVTDEHAAIWLPAGDHISLSRSEATVRYTTQEPLLEEAILHPLLGLPAAIASLWHGRLALHGGAFTARSGGWALLGEREAGKSTTLAHLLDAGHPVITDDVLIFEGTTVFAGPRTIDLRAEPAAILGGEAMGLLGSRVRWRLRPRPVDVATRLTGFVKLEWGHKTHLELIGMEERLRVLIANSALRPTHREVEGLLELTALPMWRFTRSRTLTEISEPLVQLLATLDA